MEYLIYHIEKKIFLAAALNAISMLASMLAACLSSVNAVQDTNLGITPLIFRTSWSKTLEYLLD